MNSKSALSDSNTVLHDLVQKCASNGFSMFFSVGLGIKQGRCEMKDEIIELLNTEAERVYGQSWKSSTQTILVQSILRLIEEHKA
jgi:hypothetical protein